MRQGPSVKRLRGDILLTIGTAALGVLLLLAGLTINGRSRIAGSFEDILGLVACAAGTILLAWWTLSLGLAFAAGIFAQRTSTPAQRVTSVVAPDYMVRIAVAVLGLNLLAIPAATASVNTTPSIVNAAPHAGTSAAMTGGHEADALGISPMWTDTQSQTVDDAQHVEPQWKPTRHAVQGGLLIKQQRTAGIQQGQVAVKPGDCLWALASAQLGSSANDLQISEQWQRWYSVNREAIGPDPDELVPGTVLVAPPTPST